jgi:hypothetical protein
LADLVSRKKRDWAQARAIDSKLLSQARLAEMALYDSSARTRQHAGASEYLLEPGVLEVFKTAQENEKGAGDWKKHYDTYHGLLENPNTPASIREIISTMDNQYLRKHYERVQRRGPNGPGSYYCDR